MTFNLKPTLEHIALVKVAAVLWSQNDIKDLVGNFLSSRLFSYLHKSDSLFTSDERKSAWQMIEDKVIGKVLQLTIAACLKDKILGYIQAVGLQILKWMEYHRVCCCLDLDLPNNFRWTPQGILDKKKTAEDLIKDENIDISIRYKLACMYCLEGDIPELWNRIPGSDKMSFSDDKNIGSSLKIELWNFWAYYLTEKMATLNHLIRKNLSRSCSSYEYMLHYAADRGNKAATEYFLQKTSPREQSLMNAAMHIAKMCEAFYPRITNPPKEYYSEVLCYLLSKMNDELQMKLFEEYAKEAMRCLLNWPWQIFFLETANKWDNFLSSDNVWFLLIHIVHKVNDGSRDYNYQKLFREFWQQIYEDHKSCFIHEKGIINILHFLFDANDKENLKFIYQNVTLAERYEIIFDSDGLYFCYDVIQSHNNWDMLIFFLQLSIPSKDEMIKFKDEFEAFTKHRAEYIATRVFGIPCRHEILFQDAEENRREFGENFQEIDEIKSFISSLLFPGFFQLLDDLIREYDKGESKL